MTLVTIQYEIEKTLLAFINEKKSGKVTVEINVSQGGIGQAYLETREAINMKR